MREDVKRILTAYFKEKKGLNYTDPLRNDMERYPFYNDQEQSYTDLTHLNSPYGGPDPQKYDKMFVYPETETTNPDWAGGNFLSPYQEDIFHKELWRTPNDAENLMDPQMTIPEMHGLNSRTSAAIDSFLNDSNSNFQKISSMDLTDFMRVSSDTLIHKSRKDLWQMVQDSEGNIFIKRLFDDDVLKED